eukprot:scaffold62827_cov64-Cyclotella_meneghiniana.AAC.3
MKPIRAGYRTLIATAARNLSPQHEQNIASIFRCELKLNSHFNMSAKTQSNRLLSTNSQSPQEDPVKKSKHSKLLRVTSSRNLNRHFAMVEADMLHLHWDRAMKALVDDWTETNKWGSFVELEDNIRAYVDNNLPFLIMKWKKGEIELVGGNEGMQLSDRIRIHHFPYEQVILTAAKHAISGSVQFSNKHPGGGKVAEIEARQAILRDVEKILSSMTKFEFDQQFNSKIEWTAHHQPCSTCFRLVASGSFLMWRRLSDAQNAQVHAINEAEEEMCSRAKKWLSFCTNGHVDEDGKITIGENLIGGIDQSDKALLMGITKGLSLSKNPAHQAESSELNTTISDLF